ncbi:MAG TPA: phasin family protein [Salinisphaeraceae bacterium]|nr:phasin family protein [Salinisphaeraceae bacterium]
MYQNMTSEIRNGFKPVMNIFQVQAQTAQKLVQDQIAFANECVDAGARVADKLSDSRDVSEYFSVPMDASREIGQKWMDIAGRQWDTLVEAGNSLNGEVIAAAQSAESTFTKASEEVQQNISKVAGNTKSAGKKSA